MPKIIIANVLSESRSGVPLLSLYCANASRFAKNKLDCKFTYERSRRLSCLERKAKTTRKT
jgi:hypothetical protein